MRTRTRSRRRIVRRVGLVALAAGVLATAGFVIWAEHPMEAEPGPLAAARADPAITYTDRGGEVVLTPKRPDGSGLVFISGARVDAAAYASKLSGLADAGTTVVIVRPFLNFAIFETRSLASFEQVAPAVRTWLVGGHSLGGVKACESARDAAGLVLLGSYCATDLSSTDLPVLSLGGERDGLSTPAKIADARHLLPADAQLVEIPGAVHAQFGDYGEQPGDGTPTASDSAVRAAVTDALVPFVAAATR
jgi:pimeloyl-ACP methyl ester carboxylesterase